MRSLRLATFLALATLLVAVPVFHTHPFGDGGDGAGLDGLNVCAMCAVAAQQITVVHVVIAAPAVVVDSLIAVATHVHSVDAGRSLASRAPPAA